MTDETLIEKLNHAIDVLLTGGRTPAGAAEPELAELVQLASDLCALPNPGFRSGLKEGLMRAAAKGAEPPARQNDSEGADLSTDAVQQRLGDSEIKGKVPAIPPGFHTITPYLQVDGARRLIDFMTEAFGAEEVHVVPLPDGSVLHAEVKVDDSMLELADAGRNHPIMLGAIHLYVDDVDAAFNRAVNAGAAVLNPVTDQPYGDREAAIKDPVGNSWYLATHKAGHRSRPEGLRAITPYLHPRGAHKMIEFLKQAFDAEVIASYDAPDGTVAHAKIKIGDSVVEMGEAHDQWGPSSCAIHLYTENADAVYRTALAAGATSMFEPRDEPYGDRASGVTDPFGNVWYIATHQRRVSHEPAQAVEDEVDRPVRAGFTTVTPYIAVKRATELIDFTKQVFGAEEVLRHTGSAGGIHCEVRIGDSMLMIGGGDILSAEAPTALHVYVPDADEVYRRALEAGAVSLRPPADQFYGERSGSVRDPFGNNWYISTSKGDRYIPTGRRAVQTCFHPVRSGPVISFLKSAFGGIEEGRAQSPDGVIHHVAMRIGTGIVEMGDAHAEYQPMHSQLMLYMPDVDEAYRRALQAGAVSIEEPGDQPYGERRAGVADPFGNKWYISAPISSRS